MKKIMKYGLGFMAMALASVNTVLAEGEGTLTTGNLTEVTELMTEIGLTQKIAPMVSAGLNIMFALGAITAIILAIWNFAQSRMSDNPQDQKSKQKFAMNCLIALAVCVVGTLLVNLLLRMFGLGGIFQIR